MDGKVLEDIYLEKLEERLIEYLSDKHGIDYLMAMDAYYKSELAGKINEGKYGIQYLDYKVLADIMEQTEPNLIRAEIKQD